MAIQSMQTAELVEKQAATANEGVVIHLPLGLLGFEQVHWYNLWALPGEAPFLWLRRRDDCSLGFLLISPFEHVSHYRPDVHQDDVAYLKLNSPSDALVLNIVTLQGNGKATVNLKGPLIINRHTRIGKQVVPRNAADYSVQHPLPVAT